MSWLKGLAGKAEDFLNQIDQNAAVALQIPTEQVQNGEGVLTEVTWDNKQETQPVLKPTPRLGEPSDKSGGSTSSLSSLSKSNQFIGSLSARQSPSIQSVRSTPNLSSFTPVISSKPKSDDALIEFLNKPSSSPVLKKRSEVLQGSREDLNKPRSRPRTPLKPTENGNIPHSVEVKETSVPTNNFIEITSPKPNMEDDKNPSSVLTLPNKEVDELRTENQLLQNELRSFNNEMSLLLQRSKAAEKECLDLRQKISVLETTNRQYCQSVKDKEDHITRLEMESQRLNKELSSAHDYTERLQSEIVKLKQDSVISSGAQSEAMLACRQQLADQAEELERLKSVHHQEILALNNSIHSLKSEKNSLSSQVDEIQQLLDDCRKEITEWEEKFNKSHAEVTEVRAELDQYRVRAQRILQDKEKLISELRGDSTNRGSPVDDLMDLELEQLRQERELVREEAIQVSARLQATRAELAEAERKYELFKDQALEAQSRLQESLHEERKRRQAAEEDCRTHGEGLHSVREELTRQRGLLATKLREREAELTKLRTQLSQRPISPTGEELESRLHALTQTLVQKQNSLETITTERNALRLQYEKTEMKHREAMALLYQYQGTVNVNDTDDAKARVPSFLEESPFDTGVARRVKRAYSNLDAVSIRTGVFLRRYPLARILVFCYMVLLHIWVMVVLFTYTPEVHPVSDKSSKGPP